MSMRGLTFPKSPAGFAQITIDLGVLERIFSPSPSKTVQAAIASATSMGMVIDFMSTAGFAIASNDQPTVYNIRERVGLQKAILKEAKTDLTWAVIFLSFKL